jgi:hypothetical protein
MKPLVDSILETILQYAPAPTEQTDHRIQELEAELQALRQHHSSPPTQHHPSKRQADTPPAEASPAKRQTGNTPLAKFFSPSKSVPSSSVQQSESQEHEADPPSPWQPQSKPLSTDSPKGSKDNDVKQWMQTIKKKLTKDQQRDFDAAVKEIKRSFHDLPPAQKPSLPDVAAGYGLPVILAAKLTEDSLLGVIATAIHLAAN